MQEIKKRRIVIASILKPVDDTRMFEKMGQSIAAKSDYEVFIVGFPSQAPPYYPGIMFIPFSLFHRISLARLLAPWKTLLTILRIKPHLVIITTHELILPGLIIKILSRTKIIYDIRENYFRNILHTTSFPFWMRPFIAGFVRFKEICFSPFIDYFFLAEKGYENEFHFPGKNNVIIENKFKTAEPLLQKKSEPDGLIHLVFSGTLAESTGVFEAIELAKELHRSEPKIKLSIIGYCAQTTTLQRIRRKIGKADFIRLIGGANLVPHHEVLAEIHRSDFGIIAYPYNPSTKNSIPTKLYEYLGMKLPILLINHPPWLELCTPCNAAIPFDPTEINAEQILSKIKKGKFYSSEPQNIYWKSEAAQVLNVLNRLLSSR